MASSSVGAGAVATYRIYRVAGSGRLRLGQTFEAPDDARATALARELLVAGEACELWEGGRIVGRFSKLSDFTKGG